MMSGSPDRRFDDGRTIESGSLRSVTMTSNANSASRSRAWAGAPVLSGFVQHEPFAGQSATERTEVRIVFDKEQMFR